MLLMGDEARRTQGGNNNAYCQDNEISWFDWSLVRAHQDIHRFVRLLLKARLRRDAVEENGISLNELVSRAQVQWHGVRLGQPDWSDHSHSLACTFKTIKGYEQYENMTMPPEAVEAYAADFGKSAVTGTPKMILERMWELKRIYKPQGFFPHVYFGSMPQNEALKNMHLFAQQVLPEVKGWEADMSIDDRFVQAAR